MHFDRQNSLHAHQSVHQEIKGLTHKNVDVDGAQTSTGVSFQNRCHVNGTNSSAATTDVSEPRSTVMERMTAGINPMNHQLAVRYDSRFTVVC